MSAPSASWENTLERVKELPTLNKVYLYLWLDARPETALLFQPYLKTLNFLPVLRIQTTYNRALGNGFFEVFYLLSGRNGK